MTNLLVVGDFSPQGRLSSLGAMSPAEVLGDFHDMVANADLATLNLESPLCEPRNPITKTGPALHGTAATARFITASGFNLACLANNHIMDYGADGLQSTITSLNEVGLAWTGAGPNMAAAAKPFFHESRGTAIGVLNFAENEWSTTQGNEPGANPLDPVRNFQAIRECRTRADQVVVICHGGHEMHSLPSPRMKELFRFYVDAGANAVINHHTHCTSGYEIYRGAPIFYSLGNFLFDSPSRREGPWTKGMAVELTFQQQTVDFEIYHFDQCAQERLFRLAEPEEASRRDNDIRGINTIIADDKALQATFQTLTSERQREYQSYLEPRFSRLISAAQRRHWLPSLVSRRQRTLLLNLMRCESHREILLELLKRDVGNSQ